MEQQPLSEEKLASQVIKGMFEQNRLERRYRYFRNIMVALLVGASLGFPFFSPLLRGNPADVSTLLHARDDSADLSVSVVERISGNSGATASAYIPVIAFRGTIGSGGITPKQIDRIIRRIQKEPNLVNAVVLDIASPGGELIATDNIHRMIMTQLKGRHMFAYVGEMAASGGYYIALTAQEILAHPLARVGSIGVIMQKPDISQLAEKIGIGMETVKSGQMKDMGSMFRKFTDSERALLQDFINESQEWFMDRLLLSRGVHIKTDDIPMLTDGRVFSARTGKRLGLVDQINYRDEAFAYIADKIGRDAYREFIFFKYSAPESLFGKFSFAMQSMIRTVVREVTVSFLEQ